MSNLTQMREVALEVSQKRKKSDEVDKEKVKAAYHNDVVSLEVLQIPNDVELKTIEEAEDYYAERVKHKMYLITDTQENYIIRLTYTEKKKELKSIDPDHMCEADEFEISETIQDILRENLFPIIESNFPQRSNNEK